MLQSLYIRNYAIIDEVSLDFDAGFNVITGETGAGKSILLGALGLILGNRADTKVLYHQDQKCIVEAVFKVDKAFLSSLPSSDDYDLENPIKLRREINNSGKSRAFISDTPVRLSDLKAVATRLVDIHNQFDTLSITTQEYQRQVIDTYSNSQKQQDTYRKQYQIYTGLKQKLKELKARQSKGKQDQEYLLFQLAELEKIPLDDIDKEALENEYQTLNNSEEIQMAISHLQNELTEDEHSVESRLFEISRQLSQLAAYSKPLSQLSEDIERIIEDVQSAERSASSIIDQIDSDPERVMELKETLDHVNMLESKHHTADISELIRLRDDIAEQTSSTSDLASLITKTESELEAAKKELWTRADALTAKRQACGDKLSKNIEATLKQLAISNAQIQLKVTELPDFEEHGIDHIDILFSSNKGIAPQSIEGVASGGELSRLALSVKALLAGHFEIPTLIFDEIDTGISGAVALQLGHILSDMSDKHQIICITHSPQVASIQGKHFFIHKRDTAERTITHVHELSTEERMAEVAKMLSTDPPTAAALENARELLGA